MKAYLVMWFLTDTDMYEMKSFSTEKEAWDYIDVLKEEDKKHGDKESYDVYKRVTHFYGSREYYTYEKVKKG